MLKKDLAESTTAPGPLNTDAENYFILVGTRQYISCLKSNYPKTDPLFLEFFQVFQPSVLAFCPSRLKMLIKKH